MANLSDPNFFDVGKNPPRTRVVTVGGQRRVEKIPNGKTELWVNGAGVIVWVQILPAGHPPAQVTIDRAHNVVRRKKGNWVRLNECPLKPGSMSTVGLSDFPAELQRACPSHDGKGACSHVRHLIQERKAKRSEDRTERHALMRKRETERKAAEARREQQQQELNESLLQIVKRVGGEAPAAMPASSPAEPKPPKPPRTSG